jgi:hypothetical protein
MKSTKFLFVLFCSLLCTGVAHSQSLVSYTFSCQAVPGDQCSLLLEAQSNLPENTVFVVLLKSGDVYVDKGARLLQNGSFRWANEAPLSAGMYDLEVMFQSSYQTDPEVLKIIGGTAGDKISSIQGMDVIKGLKGVNKLYTQKVTIGSQADIESRAALFSGDMITILRNYAEAYAVSKKNYWEQLPNRGTPALISEEEWGKKRVENYNAHLLGVQEILKEWLRKASLPMQKQVLAVISTKINTYVSAMDAIYYLDLKGEDIMPAVPYHEYYTNDPYSGKPVSELNRAKSTKLNPSPKEHKLLNIRFIEREIEASFDEVIKMLKLSASEAEGIVTPIAEANAEKKNVLSAMQQGVTGQVQEPAVNSQSDSSEASD